MDANPPNNPTQGTPNYPGPDQSTKPGQNQPKIGEKSMKNVFPAKSPENSEKKRGNVSGPTDAPKTNDREDGKKTNPKQQGPPPASERGMEPTPTTSSTTSSSSTAGTSSGARPKTTGSNPKTTKSTKAKKGKKINSVTEDITNNSNSEYSSTSEKGDSTNQARFGKMNKVIKELIEIPNPNLQGHPEVQAPLQHNWGKEHETKQCAIDMYAKEEAARDLLAKLNTPRTRDHPSHPQGPPLKPRPPSIHPQAELLK